jgi:hypothetical protein
VEGGDGLFGIAAEAGGDDERTLIDERGKVVLAYVVNGDGGLSLDKDGQRSPAIAEPPMQR